MSYAMIKKIKLKGSDEEICLKYSALTYIIYKNYFGTDFMQDLFVYGAKKADYRELLEKAEKSGIEELKNDELSDLIGNVVSSDIWLKFGVACIATYAYPKNHSAEEIIDRLPPDICYDNEFLSAVSDLISSAAEGIKKKM